MCDLATGEWGVEGDTLCLDYHWVSDTVIRSSSRPVTINGRVVDLDSEERSVYLSNDTIARTVSEVEYRAWCGSITHRPTMLLVKGSWLYEMYSSSRAIRGNGVNMIGRKVRLGFKRTKSDVTVHGTTFGSGR